MAGNFLPGFLWIPGLAANAWRRDHYHSLK